MTSLPAPERIAFTERQIAAAGLAQGTYDDNAHAQLMAAPASMRAAAERAAAIARYMVSRRAVVQWADLVEQVRATFGAKGCSEATLRRILDDVAGVDPINFAPALLADHKGKTARAGMSDEAWAFFMTTIRDAGPEFPLIQAWRDVRDVAPAMCWQWPSYPTVFRHWQSLPVAQRLHARVGHAEAVKRIAQPAMRDKTTILPLEWVSLDGRTKDFWAHNGDGKPRRYTFLALVDCATSFVLDWELVESENARATVRLIKRTCETYGIFDRLYPDNGAAFAGHLVAGGAVHRFRNKPKSMDDVKPLGICHHLGIDLHFALPANGQAKTAERTFASLSRVIDDRPEFRSAHAGHKPGAAPDANVVPLHVDKVRDILTREVRCYNAEPGRRGQGMNGRSYQAAFEAGRVSRIPRMATKRQLHLAGLIYTPVTVDRFARIRVDNWTYGQPDTLAKLLPFHKKGEILLGRDPDDFDAPALAFDGKGNLICEGIQVVKAGAYGSVDGARDAARNRKAARQAVSAGAKANDYLITAQMDAFMGMKPTPDGPAPAVEAVVKGQFKTRIKPGKQPKAEGGTVSAITPEMMEAHNAYLAQAEAKRKQKLA